MSTVENSQYRPNRWKWLKYENKKEPSNTLISMDWNAPVWPTFYSSIACVGWWCFPVWILLHSGHSEQWKTPLCVSMHTKSVADFPVGILFSLYKVSLRFASNRPHKRTIYFSLGDAFCNRDNLTNSAYLRNFLASSTLNDALTAFRFSNTPMFSSLLRCE